MGDERPDVSTRVEIDGDGATVEFEFGEATTRYLRRVVRNGLEDDDHIATYLDEQRSFVTAFHRALDETIPPADGGESDVE